MLEALEKREDAHVVMTNQGGLASLFNGLDGYVESENIRDRAQLCKTTLEKKFSLEGASAGHRRPLYEQADNSGADGPRL